MSLDNDVTSKRVCVCERNKEMRSKEGAEIHRTQGSVKLDDTQNPSEGQEGRKGNL